MKANIGLKVTILSSIFFAFIFAISYNEYIGICLLLLSTGAIIGGLLTLGCERDLREKLFVIFILGFLLRSFLAIYFSQSSLAAGGWGYLLREDDTGYSNKGYNLSEYWRKGIFPQRERLRDFIENVKGYAEWNALCYYIFDNWNVSCAVLLLTNCILGSTAAFLIYFISRKIFSKNVACISMIAATFWPSLVFWSILNLKDTAILFAINLFILSFLKLSRRPSIFGVFGLVSSYLLLCETRRTTSIILYFLCAPVALLMSLLGPRHFFRLLIFITFSIFMIVLLSPEAQDKITHYCNVKMQEAVERRINLGEKADTSFFEDFLISKTQAHRRLFLLFPIGMLYVSCAPFPWQIEKIKHFFGAGEMLLIYLFFTSFISGVRHSLREHFNKSIILVLVILTTSLSMAFIEGNVGTIHRHRSMFLSLFLVFWAVGLEAKIQSKRGLEDQTA